MLLAFLIHLWHVCSYTLAALTFYNGAALSTACTHKHYYFTKTAHHCFVKCSLGLSLATCYVLLERGMLYRHCLLLPYILHTDFPSLLSYFVQYSGLIQLRTCYNLCRIPLSRKDVITDDYYDYEHYV